MRGEWRSAIITSGAQSVMIHLAHLKLQWLAGNLATPVLVSTMHAYNETTMDAIYLPES